MNTLMIDASISVTREDGTPDFDMTTFGCLEDAAMYCDAWAERGTRLLEFIELQPVLLGRRVGPVKTFTTWQSAALWLDQLMTSLDVLRQKRPPKSRMSGREAAARLLVVTD